MEANILFYQLSGGETYDISCVIKNVSPGARFGSTYTKIGTIHKRLAWPLRKDDMQIREVFHIFYNIVKQLASN